MMTRILHVVLTLSMCLFFIEVKPQELVPSEKEALVNVVVTDFHEKPRNNEAIIFESKKNGKTLVGISKKDGRFSILIPKGDTYLIKFRNFGDIQHYAEIAIPNDEGLMSTEMQIKIQPPTTYTLENVLFETGSARLQKSSFNTLDNLVEVLKIKNTMVVEIAGHTDITGTAEGNLKLSEDRAASVRNYIISKGIGADRVKSKGYGQNQPVASNETDEGRAKNRRTEVRVLSE